MRLSHLLVRGDSLTLPRPERYDPPGLPLVTRLEDTFPEIVGRKLGIRISNLSRRGMDLESFADGIGYGLSDMIHSFEPDIFLAAYGYAHIWHMGDPETVRGHARDYLRLLEELASAKPQATVLVLELPLPGPELALSHPNAVGSLEAFNSVLFEGRVPVIAASAKLHSDQQHFSNEGHREVAANIISALNVGLVAA